MPKAEPEYATTKRRRRPALPSPAVRMMDLYGRPESGGPRAIWQRDAQVVPVSAFETDGRYIVSGHYVIDHNGAAVVVHCGNYVDGTVSLLFMRGDSGSRSVPRAEIEPLLLGKVVVDKAAQDIRAAQLRELARMFNRIRDDREEV
jgi:hypothetical protein